MKRELPGKKLQSDQRSAARFLEMGGALKEVHRLPKEVLGKRDHLTSTKFRIGVIRRVHELSKGPPVRNAESPISCDRDVAGVK
jgi:hypothetical protein